MNIYLVPRISLFAMIILQSYSQKEMYYLQDESFCSALSWLELSCAAVCLGTPPTGTRLPMMSRNGPVFEAEKGTSKKKQLQRESQQKVLKPLLLLPISDGWVRCSQSALRQALVDGETLQRVVPISAFFDMP